MEIGQQIREEGPQGHMVKRGTPTMGGVLIVGSVLISTLAVGATVERLRLDSDDRDTAVCRDRFRGRLLEDGEAAKSRV